MTIGKPARMHGAQPLPRCSMVVGHGLLILVGLGLTACGPQRKLVRYPEGALQVRYESAPDHSSCLVAAVVMAANHLLDRHAFSVERVRASLKDAQLDETLIKDLKSYLSKQGLDMVCLRQGRLDGKPPVGLRYWLEKRGYPIICIINRDPDGQPGFNHAVVVIGISGNPEDPSTDIIQCFDPSTNKPLWGIPAAEFETLWDRCDRAMMIVVALPAEAAQPGRATKESR